MGWDRTNFSFQYFSSLASLPLVLEFFSTACILSNTKRSAADDIGRQFAKSTRLQPKEPQILDPNGDLIIIMEVNETGQMQADDGSTPTVEKEFLVSSNILRLISPIFRGMLASNLVEGDRLNASSEGEEIPPLVLPNDHSLGMQLLLRIAHHHPLSVAEEESLTMHNVGAFALACDRYRCLDTFTFRAAAVAVGALPAGKG